MAGSRFSLESILTLTDGATVTMNRMANNATALSKHMHKQVGGMAAIWQKFGGIIKTAIAGLTIGAATKAITDFADHADEVARMANILGVSTNAMQEYNYAAKMSDMTSEELAGAFKKMNNSMGQLKAGGGPLFAFLKKVNPQLALQLMHTNNTEDAVRLLTDAIAKETDVAKRAALTQAAFGRGGQGIIEMAAHMSELRKEFQKSGAMISPADIAAGKELHETLKRLTVMGQGFLNRVLGRAVQKLAPLVEKFFAWADANKEIIGQKIDRFINFIAKAATLAYNIFKKWGWVILWVGGAIVLMNVALKVALIIQVVGKAFAVASAVMLMFQSGASLATVAQWALNAAMDANPVGAVILAMMALIAVVVLVIVYWKQITGALREAWDWFNKLFGNPWIANAVFFILSPLWLVISAIRTIVDLLSGKGWRSFENLIPPWMKGIGKAFGYQEQAGAGNWAAPGEGQTTGFGALRGVEGGYANPKTQTAESKSFQEIVKKMSVNLTVPKGFGLQPDDGSAFPDTSMDFGEQ